MAPASLKLVMNAGVFCVCVFLRQFVYPLSSTARFFVVVLWPFWKDARLFV